MGLLQFNQTSLRLTVTCGPLEAFKPNKEVKELHKKVQALLKLRDKYLDNLKEIVDKVEEINEKNYPELKELKKSQSKEQDG